MIGFIGLVDSEIKIQENLEKIRQKRCDSHSKYKASHFCTNISCVKNSTSFLCELCLKNHSKNHFNCQEIKTVDEIFSTKRLTQIKEDFKIDSSHTDKISQVLKDIDEKFGKLKVNINKIVDEECDKAKALIKQKYSEDNEPIMKIVKEHEQLLLNLFAKDEIMNNFELTINPYLQSFAKISEAFLIQMEIGENRDKNIDLFLDNFAKSNEKHKDIVDFVQQKISNFDDLYDNLELKDQKQSANFDEILIKKLQTDITSTIKIDKKIHRLHTDIINKMISYENNTKYITCSADKTIIIRNCEDNTVIRTLIGHQGSVCDILLLPNKRLASSSGDKTIKIWNLTNGNCEQTLIGHSNTIHCLSELTNSILLSGSSDSSIGLWDISQMDIKELQFYHQVKNTKQSYAYCMSLINENELAVSSSNDINIYLFDNVTNKSFDIIKTLKGHTDLVKDIKLIKNSQNLLVSLSNDKNIRLWNISQGNCLRIFGDSPLIPQVMPPTYLGGVGSIFNPQPTVLYQCPQPTVLYQCPQPPTIHSIQILSDKIFLSKSKEINFWDINSTKSIRSIQPDKSGNIISSVIMNNENELIFAGGHAFIGLIKI